MTTLAKVRECILDRRETLSDEIISIKSLMMDPIYPGKLIVRRPNSSRQDEYDFDKRIYSQAPSVVYGLPGSYLEKLIDGKDSDHSLAAMNFNHWVKCSNDKDVLLRFRKEKDAKIVRAMKSATWNPIPYEDSVESFIAKFGEDKEVNFVLSEDRMIIDFVTKEIEPQVWKGASKIGDPIKWGVRFKDSDAGVGDMTLGPYTMRLLCLNGATSMTKGVIISFSHTSKETGVISEIMSQLRQGIEIVDSYSAKVVEQIEAASSIKLKINQEDQLPLSALTRLRKDFLVTGLEEKYIKEGWYAEQESIPDNTLYRLSNALTRAGTHAEELDEDRKLKLQIIGGRVLETALLPEYSWN